MRNILIDTKNGITAIKEFVKNNPRQAENLELFAFTEKPEEIDDLLMDIEAAINGLVS